MTATELKALEKLTKEILEKVKTLGQKKSAENYEKAIDKINTKLDTIDERLAVPNTKDTVSAEIISKVDALTTKIEEKSEDYIKEIQLAFDTYNQKNAKFISDTANLPDGDIKDFVSIITNEMMELKAQFEKFNTEFTDINLNTGMAISKEILSLKNFVLSLNDSVDNIKNKVDNFNPDEDFVNPVSENIAKDVSPVVEEVFSTALSSFKNDVYSVIAKMSDGIIGVSKEIKTVSDNLKTFENIEVSLGEVIHNQQKNKADILKILQNSIEEENKKLLPQIMQIVNSVSFDEDAEEIKDGLYAINENLSIVNKNVENGSETSSEILSKIDDISQNISSSNEQITDIVKNDIAEKISKMDSVLDSVSNEFNILTRGSKEDSQEYLYTLQDLETDISKVRVILDELTHSIQDDRSLAENVTKNISDKISNVNSFIEKTSEIYASPDYKAILMNFDALNDDITSISKRTNKLILTSDDASEKLQKNIEDFQDIMANIYATVQKFEKSTVLKNLNIRCDNIQKQLSNLIQSEKAINEAFVYLASWVDSTSDDMKNIKDDLIQINEACKNPVLPEIELPKTDLSKIEKLLAETNKKLDDNACRIEVLEQQLEKVSAVSSENKVSPALTKKLNKIEKQLQQLLNYVEEDEE